MNTGPFTAPSWSRTKKSLIKKMFQVARKVQWIITDLSPRVEIVISLCSAIDMHMDMASSTNVGTYLLCTYSSSVWCVEWFECCVLHDSSLLYTSACIFKNKDIILHNHETMIKFKKSGIVTILLLIFSPNSIFANCPNIVFSFKWSQIQLISCSW